MEHLPARGVHWDLQRGGDAEGCTRAGLPGGAPPSRVAVHGDLQKGGDAEGCTQAGLPPHAWLCTATCREVGTPRGAPRQGSVEGLLLRA